MIKNRKIGFIGTGNMGQAMIKALIESGTFEPSQIVATNRSPGKLKKVQESFGITPLVNNEELIEACDTVILAIKPQDLVEALEPIASAFQESHVVISVAAGITLKSLRKLLPAVSALARIMPNTPVGIRRAVIGYCLASGAEASEPYIQDVLGPMGYVVRVEEGEQFSALTVSCGSGTGFVLELMQYWQEWIEEHAIAPEVARRMTVETFLGAALMAEKAGAQPLMDLQDKVVSKKGVTAAGLQSMRELEIERALRYSFEKAVLRDTELGRT